MDRVTFIAYRGKQVLIEDFSNLRPGDDFLATLETARTVIRGQPAKSVLALFDATHSTFNAEAIGLVKDFTAQNEPFVKAAAVVGIEGLLSIALMAVSTFSRRTFKPFKDRQPAMDWLVAQP